MKISIMLSSPFPCSSYAKLYSSAPYTQTTLAYVLFSTWPSFTPILNNGRNYGSVYFDFMFSVAKEKKKDSGPDNSRHSPSSILCYLAFLLIPIRIILQYTDERNVGSCVKCVLRGTRLESQQKHRLVLTTFLRHYRELRWCHKWAHTRFLSEYVQLISNSNPTIHRYVLLVRVTDTVVK
jgi:hypothetical protein